MKRKYKKAVLFYLLAICIIAVYFYPVYILCISSVKPLSEIYIHVTQWPSMEIVTWQNFRDALEGMEYFRTLFHSVFVSGMTAFLTALFASMAAWVLVRYKRKLSVFFYFMFAMSMLMPFQCIMLPLTKMLVNTGMTNHAGLIFSYLGIYSSMSVVLVHGFIKTIPVEIEESAVMDGCNMVKTFFIVVFPLLKAIIVTVVILSIINTWNDYLLPSLVINRPGIQTLPLKTFQYVSQFVKRWDLASAGMVLCIIPILIFYIAGQKYIIQGVTDGAIKG